MTEKKAKKTLIYAGAIAAVIGMGIGAAFGMGLSARQQLNVAIRDAMIVEYELKEASKLYNEVETVLGTALSKAARREFDAAHIGFLKSNVTGNPLPANILTDRNYKHFNKSVVELLLDYYRRWDKLQSLIKDHIKATDTDAAQLKSAGPEAKKLIETTYGAVFKFDAQQNNKLVANIVPLGTPEGSTVKVPSDDSERELYNPEGEDDALLKEPDKYVIEIGMESKEGLLANATQSHFKKYLKRLQEMGFIMTNMGQIQKDLINKISRICSQNPSAGVSPNPEEGLQEYLQKRQK